jgi:hypothetical protein
MCGGGIVETVKYLLAKHGDSPKLAGISRTRYSVALWPKSIKQPVILRTCQPVSFGSLRIWRRMHEERATQVQFKIKAMT